MATYLVRSQPQSLQSAILAWVRRVAGLELRFRSDTTFALATSAAWLLLYNVRFWRESAQAMWHATPGSVLFMMSLVVVVACLQAIPLLLMPSRRMLQTAASGLFIIAAVASHFSSAYGVLMNKDMLRNFFETDAAEVQGLLSFDAALHFVLLGIVPALLVWRCRLPAMRPSNRLRQRVVAITCLLAVTLAAMLSSSASYAVFFRQHKPVRFSLMPLAPVTSAIGVLFGQGSHAGEPPRNVSGAAKRIGAPGTRPLLLVMVVGETARADHFQLGGYRQPTNPGLAARHDIAYFPQTTSCGTATAVSVPCMFSHLARSEFDVQAAPNYMNLLDALQQAGLDVEWHDNNAGCKGVCARVRQVSHAADRDETLCRNSYCFDAILLRDLRAVLQNLQRDTVLVLHQIGSHGPAYSERYPPEREIFKPACHSHELQHCTAQEITNAYDNTIAYTDHILTSLIELLQSADDRVDSALLYVSDHGESLGEQGLYLHGLPYRFAPAAQKRVPMLMWLSNSYVQRTGIGTGCLQAQSHEPASHDNVYHTVLGAADVRNTSYDASLDLLSRCRRLQTVDGHE